jgi:hypothetical protein
VKPAKLRPVETSPPSPTFHVVFPSPLWRREDRGG